MNFVSMTTAEPHMFPMDKKDLAYRFEAFGGIISCQEPPFLAYVDKTYMRELGFGESPLWEHKDSGTLSAPTEVHFSITNRCSFGCNPCYMDSKPNPSKELASDQIKQGLRRLRDMGVFHIAMGGGEAFERPDFLDLARFARDIGLVPNLTTNGQVMTREIARQCRVFGQINVSIDAVGKRYREVRGVDGWTKAEQAVRLLKSAGCEVGINCLVSHKNYPHLHEVADFALRYRLHDIEFLRYKPFGRGRRNYACMRLTLDEHKAFYPRLQKLLRAYDIDAKIDCSFVPMMCYHRPNKKRMEQLAVYGCEAGNVLVGVKADGTFSGCSFMENHEGVFDLAELWHESEHLTACRSLSAKVGEPCRSCGYLDVCKGGCHCVSKFVTGDFFAPDPECPWVEGAKAI